MELEKVSIIVPIYGVEKYLSRCVDSLLAQTYSELEILLVDDGSPDKCGEICDDYARKDERITVIHKGNGGLSDARNVGIAKSNGEWLIFVDSDDCVSPLFVEKLYNAAKETSCDIAQCNYVRFSDEIPCVEPEECMQTVVSSLDVLKNIDRAENMAACNKIYRADLFKNIRFPKGRIHEDVATTYKLFAATDNVCFIEAELYYYYRNPNSITTSKMKNNKLDLVDAYIEQVEFFSKKEEYRSLYITASNNLVATFGTFASYEKSKYADYDEFNKRLVERYKEIRPILTKLPLRTDLKISVALCKNSLFFMKLISKIKLIVLRR